MHLRHQSSAMCIIMLGGEDTHPWSATKVGNPIPATIPVAKRNNQQTFHTSHCRSRPVELFKSCNDSFFLQKIAICNKFLRTHLCRSQFLVHKLKINEVPWSIKRSTQLPRSTSQTIKDARLFA